MSCKTVILAKKRILDLKLIFSQKSIFYQFFYENTGFYKFFADLEETRFSPEKAHFIFDPLPTGTELALGGTELGQHWS